APCSTLMRSGESVTTASRSVLGKHFSSDPDADIRGEAATGEHAEDPPLPHFVVQPSGGGGLLRSDFAGQLLFSVDFGHSLGCEFGADALLAQFAFEHRAGQLAVLPLSADEAVSELLVVEQAGLLELDDEFVDGFGHQVTLDQFPAQLF